MLTDPKVDKKHSMINGTTKNTPQYIVILKDFILRLHHGPTSQL